MKTLQVSCPQCKKKFDYYSSPVRPFCSERCKLIDMGHWLTESYTVPAHKLTEEEQQTLESLIHEKNDEDSEDNEENDDDSSR